MSKVLVISGSLSKKEASSSYQLLNTFLTKYKIKNPNDEIFFLDLNQEKMASITLSLNNMDTYFNEEDSDKYINQLKDVDKVIMVTPMINFMPSPLIRNYFDHVLVANKTFTYKYAGKNMSKGLLDHLKVEILITQGSPRD